VENDEAAARRRAILSEIAALGYCLPGSVVHRVSACGNPNCACHADPSRRHGPYRSWTRKVSRKTVTRRLSDDQAERYEPWFENARRLRALVRELEELSVAVAERAEGWGAK
jgi:uncharacterized protein (DUF2384 family)